MIKVLGVLVWVVLAAMPVSACSCVAKTLDGMLAYANDAIEGTIISVNRPLPGRVAEVHVRVTRVIKGTRFHLNQEETIYSYLGSICDLLGDAKPKQHWRIATVPVEGSPKDLELSPKEVPLLVERKLLLADMCLGTGRTLEDIVKENAERKRRRGKTLSGK